MSSTTEAFGRPPVIARAARRLDNVFFPCMAVLILATVFLGFARTYYLAGVFGAPLPSLAVHIHGAAFSCWILLLIAQISLVSAGRVDIHRRLGIAGFVLACLMVVLGVWAATAQLGRHAGDPVGPIDAKFFYIIPLTDILIFATLIFFAFRARFNPAAHKRLILIATIALIEAAIGRWPFAFVRGGVSSLIQFAFLLAIVGYDLWSTRKIHHATLWASVFLIVVEIIKFPIGFSHPWRVFATWVQSVVR